MTGTVATPTAHADQHGHITVEGRTPGVAPAAAVAATAAFAGGGLLTQTVIVPTWRAMDPTAFLTHFTTAGPATGATLFLIELASVLLLGRATYTAIRDRRSSRGAWIAATAGMIGTLLLLPIYFAGANSAMLDPGFPPSAVADELMTWNRWNWLRTTLALLATLLSGAAAMRDTPRCWHAPGGPTATQDATS